MGTTINGGSGTRPRVSQAVLFLWDYEREEKVWEGTLDRRISAINALVVGEDGLLYGTALGDEGPVLFAFDPVSRAFHYAIPLDGQSSGSGASEWTRWEAIRFYDGIFLCVRSSPPRYYASVRGRRRFPNPRSCDGK